MATIHQPRLGAAAVTLILALAAPASADDTGAGPQIAVPGTGRMVQVDPSYGRGYDRYEPTFYTGFAPRSQDPRRVHLHVGRGNQLRATAVLADDTLETYARDLLQRQRTYQALIEQGRVVLTQNTGFEDFEAMLAEIDLERLVAEEDGLSQEALRERNTRLLEQLNPGRIFRIEIPAAELPRRWAAGVTPEDRKGMDRKRQLERVNAMLPTRLWLAELDADRKRRLAALVAATPSADEPAGLEDVGAFEDAFFALFEDVSGGLYPRDGETVSFVEFTAVYPIGTFNEYTEYRGSKIPMYPTPGRRALTTHQRSHTVDHIPTKVIYSYSPWIPYMHVGKTMHNSFHTLWWRMTPETTSFLPDTWHDLDQGSRDGKPFNNLWLLSRGPMSHGCTHVTTGHIGELRQLMPSDTESLYEIDTFLNKSYLYDVFDIDGDFEPEVMGVEYYIAYSLKNKRPNRLRAPNERRGFYQWLYGGDLEIDDEGNGSFGEIRDGRFVERTAVNGGTYRSLRLYEQAYEPEKYQFYRLVDIPFARELRKVAVDHSFDGLSFAGSVGE